MTLDEIQKFQRRAKYVAAKSGYPQLAEDFAQELFVYFWEKPDRGATVSQLFIDYLREQHGRPGTPGGDARIAAEKSFSPIDDARDIAADPEPEQSDWRCDFLFGGREAEVYDWVYLEERHEYELADRWGVSASRVSQVLKGVKQEIAGYLILKDALERMDWDPTFGLLNVNWIRI